MPEPLTSKEKARYATCKKQIQEGLQICFDTGIALIEIRDEKLYREEYDTFEEFCYQAYHIAHSQAYRLIEAAEVKQSLPPKASKLITNERQARALAAIPEDHRAKIILQVAKSGEPITAAAIKEVAESKLPPMGEVSKSNGIHQEQKDRMGYPIPKAVQPLWDQTDEELRMLLAEISATRSKVRKVMDAPEENPVWRRVSANSVMVALDNAYREVNAGIPYAVCPYCQGRVTKSCTVCKQTGFVGRFDWNTSIPKELIAIREASMKK